MQHLPEYDEDGVKKVPTQSTKPVDMHVGDAPTAPAAAKSEIQVIPCDPLVEATLNQVEKDFICNFQTSLMYKAFCFTEPYGSMYNGSPFNDAPDLVSAIKSEDWPFRVEIDCVQEGGIAVIQRVKLIYGNKWEAGHPNSRSLLRPSIKPLHENLNGAKIVKIDVEKRLRWIRLVLSDGEKLTAGSRAAETETWSFTVPRGCQGLKGFWGRDGDKLERLGFIWG